MEDLNEKGYIEINDLFPEEKLLRVQSIIDRPLNMPSITTKDFKEPWGLVINEAMNQGCVIVTTWAVGAAAGGLVRDRETGLVVAEKDSVALHVAIETSLRDETSLTSMGEAAREEIAQWSPERAAEGFLKAIDFAL